MLGASKKEDEKKTRSKVRAFYKSLLRACDKYDEIKKSFDEIYNPINEQYKELAKIPGLISESSQIVIQNAFDSIDEATGIADDFCSTLRGEFEPILKRLKISVEEIVKEIAIEKVQANPTSIDPSTTTTASTATQTTTTIISKPLLMVIIGGIVAVGGGIGGACYAGYCEPIDNTPPIDNILPADTIAPPAPTLVTPENNQEINDPAPTFWWNSVNDESGVDHYTIELFTRDNNLVDFIDDVSPKSYTSGFLSDGEYGWKVKAVDGAGNVGPYSQTFYFTIHTIVPDTLAPPAPSHVLMTTDNVVGLSRQVDFDWNPVSDESGIDYYAIEVYKDGARVFSEDTTRTSYSYRLPIGSDYGWHVRAVDNEGNHGRFSELESFKVGFGATVGFDRKSYTLSPQTVYINAVSPDHNFNTNIIDTIGNGGNRGTITIETNNYRLINYELIETDTDTGIFEGEIMLTRYDDPDFIRTADFASNNAGVVSSESGPTNGVLLASNNDNLRIIFEYEDELVWVDAFIRAADITTEVIDVSIRAETGVPGCEETNQCYVPFIVNVNIGDTVVWINNDTSLHTVTSGSPDEGPDGLFDSSMMEGSGTFEVTFDDTGSYSYFCMIHPWMTGNVIVS